MGFVKFINWAVLLLIFGICLMIAVNNVQRVHLNLDPLPFQIDVPLFFIIFVSFLMGLLVGGLFLAFHRIRAHLRLKKANKRINELESQLRETTREDVSNTPSGRILFD